VRTARNKLKAHGMDLNDMVMDRSWDANLRTGAQLYASAFHISINRAIQFPIVPQSSH